MLTWPEAKQTFERILASPTNPDFNHRTETRSLVNTYARLLKSYCNAQQLLVDAEGYIRVCSKSAASGDEIWLVTGCPKPMILRKLKSGRYTIVGAAYVQVIMDGEAFLGPVPPTHDRVIQIEEEKDGYLYAYRNRETGHISLADPRLGPSEGWIHNRHERVIDPSANQIDPRHTAAVLKKRGVDLRVIEIE